MNPTTFPLNLFHMSSYDLLLELDDCQRQLQSVSERLLFRTLIDMWRKGNGGEYLKESPLVVVVIGAAEGLFSPTWPSGH